MQSSLQIYYSKKCQALLQTSVLHLLEVPVFVFAVGLQDNSDGGHERFDHTELQSGLLTEPQEADGVGLSSETAGTVHTAGPDGTKHSDNLMSVGNVVASPK